MRMISRICGTNSSRHSSLAGSSETVGGILAQHSRRLWGLPSPTPSPPPRRDPTPSFKSEGSLAARYDFPHRCVHPGAFSLAHTHLPLIAGERSAIASLHVLLVVLPATKLKSHCCSLTMIRTVITTRMTRSPWYLPCAGVARAVARVTIFEEELLNFHTHLP